MAAGVPVIVSDWDGYRYTVTDGLEGFLIPTLAPSRSPQGVELSFRHDHGLLSYQDYVGSLAQHVAVDIEAAAFAIARLADNPSLATAWAMLDVKLFGIGLTGLWLPSYITSFIPNCLSLRCSGVHLATGS